jgi:dihydrofolate synthase / folylpolyglutamate synthase
MSVELTTFGTPSPSRAIDVHPLRTAAVDWLLSRINYERVADIPYNERQLKLDRMRQLLTRLGRPDAGMKIVHVAGTKGKGSTSAMIAGVLTAAGYRTGLFTSPHLERIEERFAVDGEPCTADELITLVDRIRPVVAAMDQRDDIPTFFEIVTAIALVHFVERNVDVAVLEVGLGGRLDSTNVCLPTVSVITSISFDHTKQLGSTLAAIAREKAGIIKPGVPVVCGVLDDEPQRVIADVAREHGCRLIQFGEHFCGQYQTVSKGPIPTATLDFWYEAPEPRIDLANLPLAMWGKHQADNAAIALATSCELRNQGWDISTDDMREGIASTTVPGRVEIFRGEPLVVLDVAHNPASARALVAALRELPPTTRRTLILSISADKDVPAIVAELAPDFDRFIATQFRENPRAVAADKLAALIRQQLATVANHSPNFTTASHSPIALRADSSYSSREIAVCATPADAWTLAVNTAIAGELVCIAGSLFLATELRPIVRQR